MEMWKFHEHIIAVANSRGLPITKLQLQLVMYFAIKDAVRGKPELYGLAKDMYDEHFEVTRFGPQVPSIAERYLGFGASVLPTIYYAQNKYFKPLNNQIVKLLEEPGMRLVTRAQNEDFWSESDLGSKYSLKEILKW